MTQAYNITLNFSDMKHLKTGYNQTDFYLVAFHEN